MENPRKTPRRVPGTGQEKESLSCLKGRVIFSQVKKSPGDRQTPVIWIVMKGVSGELNIFGGIQSVKEDSRRQGRLERTELRGRTRQVGEEGGGRKEQCMYSRLTYLENAPGEDEVTS